MSPRANAFKYSPLHPLHPDRKSGNNINKSVPTLGYSSMCAALAAWQRM